MAAIDALFEELIHRGGSDLHLASNQPPLARVRGELVPLREAKIGAKELEAMLLEGATSAQRQRLAADLSLAVVLPYKDVARFRGTYYVTHTGVSAAFRFVPRRPPSLAELGAPSSVQRFGDLAHGLVLVASPSGNGKTTTMASLIDHVNRTRACHVVCIDHPTELVHEPDRAQITQREVGVHAPSVAAALANAALENPDVVALAELEAADEVEHAVRLASAGVLVLATVRAGSVASALERLVATVAPSARPRFRERLAGCLAGVVAQHLLRTTDGSARVAVHEVLRVTPEASALVAEGKTQALRAIMTASPDMQALESALAKLVDAGRITTQDAFERAQDKQALAAAAGL